MKTATTTVGLIANPASARDIRRLVAHGGAVTTHDKLNRLQRVLAGLAATGVERVISMADQAGIMDGLGRLAERASAGGWPALEFVDQDIAQTSADTTAATRAIVEAGVGSIVVLGGDGTNRVVAAASADVPLVSISTGTNNAFPRPVEPTVAGLAAGLVATNPHSRQAGTYRAKKLIVHCGDRVEEALVDVAITDSDGVGAGALWDATSISELFVCFAEPDAIGLSAIGGTCNRHRAVPRRGWRSSSESRSPSSCEHRSRRDSSSPSASALSQFSSPTRPSSRGPLAVSSPSMVNACSASDRPIVRRSRCVRTAPSSSM